MPHCELCKKDMPQPYKGWMVVEFKFVCPVCQKVIVDFNRKK